jgi:hypothetical protein
MDINSNGTNRQIDQILRSVWEAAARINPLLLAKLPITFPLSRLRKMIEDCLAKGLSAATTQMHAVRELLRAAQSNRPPKETCDEAAAPQQQKQPPN